MLRFLFPRLTPAPQRGDALFAAVTRETRMRHWYVDGGVPDELDGRFRVLATLTALVTVRLEQAGEAGNALAVALTERFVSVMESEHRELGLGDPSLGRTIRRLVSALSRRVGIWRAAVAGDRAWEEAVRESLFKDSADPPALEHSSSALRTLWTRLERSDTESLAHGRIE